MLAVSDPAADVTSTQTWQAVGDGRATGVWTAPARTDPGPAAPAGSANASKTAAIPRHSGAFDTPVRPTGAFEIAARDSGSHLREAVGNAGDANGDPPEETGAPVRRSSRGHSGAHTGPQQIPRSRRRDGATARPDEPSRPAGPKPRRKRPASVKLAMVTAVVLVLAALAALSYAVLHKAGSSNGPDSAASKRAISPSVSASPTPSLGQYGHIASRKADPTPLTMTELYPAAFTAGGTSVVRTAASKSTNCAAELVGSHIQSAIGSAGCDQVVRATYLASAQGVMGTIGVLNLSTAKAAATLVRAADASDFISQLAGAHGATTKIGQGTGIEEAAAKGHYLILIWAEFTNLRKPRTGAQLATVEQFMTRLLQNTANVSLTTRMLTGTP
jgi:hypothetical protein